jgi:hypothetical protein
LLCKIWGKTRPLLSRWRKSPQPLAQILTTALQDHHQFQGCQQVPLPAVAHGRYACPSLIMQSFFYYCFLLLTDAPLNKQPGTILSVWCQRPSIIQSHLHTFPPLQRLSQSPPSNVSKQEHILWNKNLFDSHHFFKPHSSPLVLIPGVLPGNNLLPCQPSLNHSATSLALDPTNK